MICCSAIKSVSMLGLCLLSLTSCSRQDAQTPSRTATPSAENSISGRDSRSTSDSSHVPELKDQPKREDVSDTIVGELYVSGNEPFARLTLAPRNSRSIFLNGDTLVLKTLWKLQGKNIRAIGTISRTPIADELYIKEYSVE